MIDSLAWRRLFEDNARALHDIPWDHGADLTADEVAAVSASVQEFQAGEYSEGHHLYQFARDYAARTGDYEYLRAIRLFIAEEQRHALHLARFLTINDIPLIRTTFADRVFRRLRNLVHSLEISIAVLVTAELIAKVYYAALREATGSRVLRRLCDQLLRDEEAHVRFQCDQLRTLRRGRTAIARILTLAAHGFLYAGTVLIVWWSHRRVIRRGGLTVRGWWTLCWREFTSAFLRQRAPAVGHPADGHRTAVRPSH